MKTPKKITNWRNYKIQELLTIRADAKVDRQIQGMPSGSIVYDQITNQLHCTFWVMSGLLHAVFCHHPPPNQN